MARWRSARFGHRGAARIDDHDPGTGVDRLLHQRRGADRDGGREGPQPHRAGTDDPAVQRDRFHRAGDPVSPGFRREPLEERTDQETPEQREEKHQVRGTPHRMEDPAEEEFLEKPDEQDERHRAEAGQGSDERGQQNMERLVADVEPLEDPVDEPAHRLGANVKVLREAHPRPGGWIGRQSILPVVYLRYKIFVYYKS